MLAPVGLFTHPALPAVGKNVYTDPRLLTAFAFVVFALVLYMRAHFNTLADANAIMLPTIVQGVAVAFFFIPLSVITLGGLPPIASPLPLGCRALRAWWVVRLERRLPSPSWQDRAAMHHARVRQGPSTPAMPPP